MAESNQNPEQAEMVEQGYRTTQQIAARSQDFVYIVVRGDTLSGIAAYYKTTVDAIVQANGIADPNVLYAGQRLVIPGATQPGKTLFYVAQYGDTLYKLARRYGTTVEAIASANNIADPNVLRVGQRLVIPGATQPGNVKVVYIVQYGDTLSGIAAYYGTTVSQIASDNHLANANQIYVGQRLVIRSA
jgi:LysM repeat protein